VADLGGTLDGGGHGLDFEAVAGSASLPSGRAASAAWRRCCQPLGV